MIQPKRKINRTANTVLKQKMENIKSSVTQECLSSAQQLEEQAERTCWRRVSLNTKN